MLDKLVSCYYIFLASLEMKAWTKAVVADMEGKSQDIRNMLGVLGNLAIVLMGDEFHNKQVLDLDNWEDGSPFTEREH